MEESAVVKSEPLYFNQQSLRDDLDGALNASILFAQTSILPSRASKLRDDIHPHLVAWRDALMLLKPVDHSTFDVKAGVNVRVLNDDGKDQML